MSSDQHPVVPEPAAADLVEPSPESPAVGDSPLAEGIAPCPVGPYLLGTLGEPLEDYEEPPGPPEPRPASASQPVPSPIPGRPLADRIMFVLEREQPGVEQDAALHGMFCRLLASMGIDHLEANVLRLDVREDGFLRVAESFGQMRPEVVVMFGGIVAQTLLESPASIERLRGLWHAYRGIPTMVTLTPASLVENAHMKQVAWADLKKVMVRLGVDVPGGRVSPDLADFAEWVPPPEPVSLASWSAMLAEVGMDDCPPPQLPPLDVLADHVSAGLDLGELEVLALLDEIAMLRGDRAGAGLVEGAPPAESIDYWRGIADAELAVKVELVKGRRDAERALSVALDHAAELERDLAVNDPAARLVEMTTDRDQVLKRLRWTELELARALGA